MQATRRSILVESADFHGTTAAIPSGWPIARLPGRCPGNRTGASLAGLAAIMLAASTTTANAADGGSAEPPAPVAFQQQEISIGEPISLPNAVPLNGTRSTVAAVTPPPATTASPAAGTGWLGIAVDDTLLTGRLVVVEVAADSPAAKAGVRQQDVLLAINGTQLHTADEMAAALAAISPGQRVKAAVGRDNKVDDLNMTAVARPAEAMTRNWQSADAAGTPPPTPRAVGVAPESAPPFGIPNQPAVSVPADLGPPPVAMANAVPTQAVGPSAATGLAVPSPARPAFQAPPSFEASAPASPLPMPSSAPLPAVAAQAILPAPAQRSPSAAPTVAGPAHAGGRIALGVRTVPVDPAVQSRFQLADSGGAFVIGVVENLPAAKAGVPPGSVIVALNQQPVRSPQELTQLVTHGPVGTPVSLQYVLPGGQSRQASVTLQSLDEPLERALVGPEDGSQPTAPPTLQPAPQTSRRPSQSASVQPADVSPLVRLEEMLRRMATRLEQIDRRLEELESRR